MAVRRAICTAAIAGVLGSGLATGCGEDEPFEGALAQVRDNAITRTDVERAMVGQLARRHSAATMPPYLPTDLKGCVTIRRKRSTEDLSEIERRCGQERDEGELAALRFLIHSQWYELEAHRRGIAIPTGKEAALSLSSHAGVDVSDVLAITTAAQLELALLPQGPADEPALSSERVTAYYRAHRTRYASEDKRYISAIIAQTRKRAEAAAAQLHRGLAPKRIVTIGKGLTIPFEGPQVTLLVGDAGLQRAARRVSRGDVGILKDSQGWYIFRVEMVLPARQQTLKEATAQVRTDIEARLNRERLKTYHARLHSRYKDDTICASGYELPDCR